MNYAFYGLARDKKLNFIQLFFDQLIECISGKKRPTYVPYPRWLVLFLVHAGMGYNINREESIPIHVLSSRIINVRPVDGDPYLSNPMMSWIQNPYEAKEHQENTISDPETNDEESIKSSDDTGGDDDEEYDDEESRSSNASTDTTMIDASVQATETQVTFLLNSKQGHSLSIIFSFILSSFHSFNERTIVTSS